MALYRGADRQESPEFEGLLEEGEFLKGGSGVEGLGVAGMDDDAEAEAGGLAGLEGEGAAGGGFIAGKVFDAEDI